MGSRCKCSARKTTDPRDKWIDYFRGPDGRYYDYSDSSFTPVDKSVVDAARRIKRGKHWRDAAKILMPKRGGRGGKRGGGKIYRGIIRQEKKIARGEVSKAKKKIKKRGKWTVAADVFGYHAGYSSKHGMFAGKGKIRERMVQPPARVAAIPASSSHLFRVRYDRKPLKNGLKVMGIQKIGDIGTVTSSGTVEAFVIGGSRVSNFYISPDAIGGQMALDARNYTFFRFKKIRLVFVMNAPSTDSYGVGVAYVPDPQVGAYQTVSYATIQQNKDIVTFTRKQMGPVILDVTELRTAQFQKYNTESDTTSDMSKRASYQGIVYGFFNASDTSSSTTYGDMLMEFELELYNRAPDYGFTLQLRDPTLVGAVARLVKEYVDAAVRMAESKERDRMRKEGGADEKTLVVFNKDPAWRAGVTNRLIGRFEGQMREALAYSQIGIPRVGPGEGARAKVGIQGLDSFGGGVLTDVTVNTGGHLQTDLNGSSVSIPTYYAPKTTDAEGKFPINIAQIQGQTLLNTDLTVVSGSTPMDVNHFSVNGYQFANNTPQLPTLGHVLLNDGVTVNPLTGMSASGPTTAMAVAVRGGANSNFATVSTSSSMQTVVSATESKKLDDAWTRLEKMAAEVQNDPDRKVPEKRDPSVSVEMFLQKRFGESVNYAPPEKLEVMMTPKVFDEFKDWLMVKYPKQKPAGPAAK